MIHLMRQGMPGTAPSVFPYKIKTETQETPTKRDSFRITFVPFGAPKTGERKRTVKGLPARDGKKFCRNRRFVSLSKFLYAFDRQSRSPTISKPKGTKMSRLGKKMRGLLRFFQQEFLFVGFL